MMPSSAQTRIFLITGHPRSGTTLLAETLGRHPEIEVLPETHFFDDAKALESLRTGLARDGLAGGLDACARLNPSVTALLAAGGGQEAFLAGWQGLPAPTAHDLFLALLEWARRGKGCRCIGEKTPNHIFQAVALGALDEQLRVIDIVRDPRDVALSWRKVPWGETDAGFVALRWCRAVMAARKAAAALGPRFLQVRYEDLVRAPAATVDRICASLGVAAVDGMLEASAESRTFDEAAEPWKSRSHTGISAENVSRWKRELGADDLWRIEMVAGGELRRMGYEEAFSDVSGPRRAAGRARELVRALAVVIRRKRAQRRDAASLSGVGEGGG